MGIPHSLLLITFLGTAPIHGFLFSFSVIILRNPAATLDCANFSVGARGDNVVAGAMAEGVQYSEERVQVAKLIPR